MVLLKRRVDVLHIISSVGETNICINIECNFSAGGIKKLRVIDDQKKAQIKNMDYI